MGKYVMMVLTFALTILTAQTAFATASSVVQTSSVRTLENGKPCRVLKLAWTASSVDGSVDDVTLPKMHGYVMKVITNPGSTAPTSNYDISVLDTDDSTADAFNSVLQNRHTTSTEVVYPVGASAAAPLYVQPGSAYALHIVNNSVNSATGVIWIYMVDSL